MHLLSLLVLHSNAALLPGVRDVQWPQGSPPELISEPVVIHGSPNKRWATWSRNYVKAQLGRNVLPNVYSRNASQGTPSFLYFDTSVAQGSGLRPRYTIGPVPARAFFDSRTGTAQSRYFTGPLDLWRGTGLPADIDSREFRVASTRRSRHGPPEPWTGDIVWLGHAGVVTPLHFDAAHNFFTQRTGRKRFLLFPPAALHDLYLHPSHHPSARQTRMIDALELALGLLPTNMSTARPDSDPCAAVLTDAASDEALASLRLARDAALRKWPRLRNAVQEVRCVTLSAAAAGTVLYLPPYWAHHVTSLSSSTAPRRNTDDAGHHVRDVSISISVWSDVDHLLDAADDLARLALPFDPPFQGSAVATYLADFLAAIASGATEGQGGVRAAFAARRMFADLLDGRRGVSCSPCSVGVGAEENDADAVKVSPPPRVPELDAALSKKIHARAADAAAVLLRGVRAFRLQSPRVGAGVQSDDRQECHAEDEDACVRSKRSSNGGGDVDPVLQLYASKYVEQVTSWWASTRGKGSRSNSLSHAAKCQHNRASAAASHKNVDEAGIVALACGLLLKKLKNGRSAAGVLGPSQLS